MQLALEQCGFELCRFGYTWIFFSVGDAAVLHDLVGESNCGTADLEG